MPRPPRHAEESPETPTNAGGRRAQLKVGVRRLTKTELDSMRREFKAASEWMERQLEVDPTSHRPNRR